MLAEPIARDTGWPLAWIVAGLSVGLLTRPRRRRGSGPRSRRAAAGRSWRSRPCCWPRAWGCLRSRRPCRSIRRLVPAGPRHELRPVRSRLCDAGRLYGADARAAITHLTLLGGFASTVCWPLSAFLVAQVGWRGTCLAYAVLHLAVTLPLVLRFIPSVPPAEPAAGGPAHAAAAPAPWRHRAVLLMMGVLVLGGATMALVSVHLITLLQDRGVAVAAAVAYGGRSGRPRSARAWSRWPAGDGITRSGR